MREEKFSDFGDETRPIAGARERSSKQEICVGLNEFGFTGALNSDLTVCWRRPIVPFAAFHAARFSGSLASRSARAACDTFFVFILAGCLFTERDIAKHLSRMTATPKSHRRSLFDVIGHLADGWTSLNWFAPARLHYRAVAFATGIKSTLLRFLIFDL